MRDRHILINGEEVIIDSHSTFWFECCDCCLTHLCLYHVNEDGNIAMRIYRDDAKTDAYRKLWTKKERRVIIEELGGTLE